MKRSVYAAFVALLAAAALTAQAGHRGGPPAFGHMDAGKGGISGACIEALGLTDAQKSSLTQLRQDLMTAVQPLFEQRRALHEQVETALEAANPDPAAIGQLVIAAHRIGDQIRSLHEQFQTRFEALLTPEQAATYRRLRENGVCAPRGKHLH